MEEEVESVTEEKENVEETISDKENSKSGKNVINYKLCCLYNEKESKCGLYCKGRLIINGLVKVQELNEDTTEHFTTLKFKDFVENLRWSERDLVENRAGQVLDSDSLICQYHRNTLGLSWRPGLQCIHPLHAAVTRGKKAPPTKLAPLWVVKKLNRENPFSFKLGGRLCDKHYRLELQTRKNEEEMLLTPPIDDENSVQDLSFHADQMNVPDDIQQKASSAGLDLTNMLSISPAHFQINKTPVRHLVPGTLRAVKRKLLQVQEESVRRFAESIAPCQSEELMAALGTLSSDSEEDVTPVDLAPLVPIYKAESSGPREKLIILSLVDHSAHTKKEVQDVFGCSKRQVDNARKLRLSSEGLLIPEKVPLRRNRMNTFKMEHFIEFIFSSGLIQDVAYGVTRLSFDSGDEQTIPHAVLTAKYSHVIGFYLQFCKEMDYPPLSESSLWRILRALKPSQRKNLAGLDDITAAGMNGFSELDNFLCQLRQHKPLISQLERGKRYLKTVYQTHCSVDSEIVTHNSTFALSTLDNIPEVPVSERVCADCFSLASALNDCISIATAGGNEETIYDVKRWVDDVIKYWQHQIRDFQQRQAKMYCFDNLDNKTGFWLKDFGQKILPIRYREGQREYFGKKGMTNHIDVFISKYGENLIKYVYLTFIFRSNQAMVDVLNIGDHVLSQFKLDCPTVENLFAKSDNAGSYHGNHMLEALFKLCKAHNFNLLRYDYNEPCKGKDQCDRESAGVKTVMNSFVSSGKDMMNANDMFVAVHYGRGIRNTKASVLEIDSEKTSLSGTTIPLVSSYHSAEFFDTHMKLYRYFNIGPGVKIAYSNSNEFIKSYTVSKSFSQTQGDCSSDNTSKKKRADRRTCASLFCSEPFCSEIFDTMEEYEAHIISGRHTIPERQSSMDNARASFVQKMKISAQSHTLITSESVNILDISMAEAQIPTMQRVSERGWALPKRSNFRYSHKQKLLLYNIFMEGERSGKKKSPDEAERIVRAHLSPDMFVTAQQIRSLFQIFSKQLKEGKLKVPVPNTYSSGADQQETLYDEADITDNYVEEGTVIDIVQEASRVFSVIGDWKEGDFIAVKIEKQWFPGKIVTLRDDDTLEVLCMRYSDNFTRINKFRWVQKDSARMCHILLGIAEPIPEGNSKRLQYYTLSTEDFSDASDVLKLVVDCK